MKVPYTKRALLLCFVSFLQTVSALSGACPNGQFTFVRRLFAKLSPDSLPAKNVILVHESPPSECYSRCIDNTNCSAYFVDYRNHSCTLVQDIQRNLQESELSRDDDSSYHRKVCLPSSDCHHEWVFDEVQGVQLDHYLDKTVVDVGSVDTCMTLCLLESTFVCRSARFDQSASECILSQHDRRTAAEYFRQSPKRGLVQYLERQCVEEPRGCQFGSRQARAILKRHRHVQVVQNVTSRADCENACLQSAPFPCRSYQYGGEPSNCLLSPEDSTSDIGPLEPPLRSLENDVEEKDEGTYFEKESCIDVEVKCGAKSMDAVVHVSTPFRGRVYAAGHPYDCYSVSVTTDGRVTLSMPLHGRQCGTRNLGNGTFVNSVVVQHHAFVLRTTDRRIDVACDYEEMKLKIRGAKAVDQGELKPLAHTVTAVAPTPQIRLRVVNASDQDVSGVELGDPLFLKVEMEDESVYGIFGSDLLARGSSGTETVLLLDENGCPVEPTVIQTLDRMPGSKSLMAPFQAFKFSSDSAVQFQMTVSYCLDTCPPVDCDVRSSSPAQSFGKRKRKRRRRRSTELFLDLQPGDIISDVTMQSPTFLVTNLRSLESGSAPGFRWEKQLHADDRDEGHVHLRKQKQDLCMSATTLYIIGAVVTAVQIAIVCLSAFLFCKNGPEIRTKTGVSSKSWPSVSSRRKLVCSHS